MIMYGIKTKNNANYDRIEQKKMVIEWYSAAWSLSSYSFLHFL